MLTQALWWTGNALLALLLLRSLIGGFFGKYPLLFVYVSYVLVRSLLCFYIFVFHPTVYQFFYWYTEFLTVSLGYCVVWEIYRQVLGDYPGVVRVAQAILASVFLAVMARVLSNRLGGSVGPLNQTTVALERDLRVVQTVLLLVIVLLILYYAIPVGRNVRGILSGYGFFVGTSLLQLTLREHLGGSFQPWWEYLDPFAFDAMLVVWCVGLWSYAPSPSPQDDKAVEGDYELLVSHTTALLTRMRRHLLRGARG